MRAHITESASLSAFASPVTLIKWKNTEELNKDLKKLIYDEMKVTKGIKISNKGGWHSDYTLFEKDVPVVKEFRQMVVQLLKTYYDKQNFDLPADFHDHWEIQIWANVNFKGSSNLSHDHTKGDNQWSGIYYLETGYEHTNKPASGVTVFEDKHYTSNGFTVNRLPVVNMNGHTKADEVVITPEVSKMCLFPGTLWHRVETYYGDKERITIAINMKNKYLTLYKWDGGSSSRFKSFLWYNFRGPMRLLGFLKRKVTGA